MTAKYNRLAVLAAAAELREAGYSVLPTGSAYLNDVGNDIDLIVDGGEKCHATVNRLLADGFEPCANTEYPDDEMWTGRRGPINAIVPMSARFHERWARATLACAMLTYMGVTLEKRHRIAIFKAVVDTDTPREDLRMHAFSQVAVWQTN